MEQIQFNQKIQEIQQSIKQYSQLDENGCSFIEKGLCEKCTCNKCTHGNIIISWLPKTVAKPCSCQIKAIRNNNIRIEGLEQLFEKCCFDSFKICNDWQSEVKKKALQFCENFKEHFFFISGNSGCGKTHICISVIRQIFESNEGMRFKYFKWEDNINRLKFLKRQASQNDLCEYQESIDKFKNVDLLYFDDFFRGKVSEADINIAYDIINARYIGCKTTILSSELSIQQICELSDGQGEAIGSRIFEMCNGNDYSIWINGDDKNYRLNREYG